MLYCADIGMCCKEKPFAPQGKHPGMGSTHVPSVRFHPSSLGLLFRTWQSAHLRT